MSTKFVLLLKQSVIALGFLTVFFINSQNGLAQVAGDYRSNAVTMNWSATASWERFDGAVWVANPVQGFPGANPTGAVTIRDGHTVTNNTVPANTIGSLTVGGGTSGAYITTGTPQVRIAGGNLTINNGATFTHNGTNTITLSAGAGIVVNAGGTFTQSGSGTVSVAGNLTINTGGIFTLSGTASLTITGTSLIAGSFTDTNNTGTNGFIGAVTVTGTWNTTAVTSTNGGSFRGGGLVQNGTFNAGGISFPFLSAGYTNQTVSGSGVVNAVTLAISLDPLIINSAVNISGDLTINSSSAVNPASLTIGSTGNVDIGDDLSIGSIAGAANNVTVTLQSGGTLDIVSDLLVNEDAAGTANDFTFNNAGTFNVNAITFAGTAAALCHRFIFNNSGTATINGVVNLNDFDDHVITNSGTLNFIGAITGLDPLVANATTITNNTNATLNISADMDHDAILDFDATGNTVNYNNTTAFVEDPVSDTYFHLIISGTANRALIDNIIVLGNLTVQNTAILNSNTRNINLKGNWSITSSNADPFLESTSTVSLTGTVNQTIEGTALGTTFHSLTINNTATSASVTLLNNIIAGGTLNLTDGNVNLNSFDLQLGTGTTPSTVGTLTYDPTTGGWLYGGTHTRYFQNTTLTPNPSSNLQGAFRVGSAADLRPFYVYPTVAPTTGGTITVTHSDPGGPGSATDLSPFVNDAGVDILQRRDAPWTVTAGGGLTDGTYTFYAGGTRIGTIGNVNHLRLMLFNSVIGTAGTNVLSPYTLAARTGILRSDIPNTFYIGTTNTILTPLPVELVYFKANLDGSSVQTEWLTAQEIQNDYFTVQKTVDFKTYYEVGIVVTKGNGKQENKYTLIDYSPLAGKSYYRLKQTDFDGTFTFSGFVMVNYTGSLQTTLDVYPNPNDGSRVTIEMSGLTENSVPAPIRIYDQQGNLLFESILTIDESGKVTKELYFTNTLPRGLYIIKAGKNYQFTRKLIVQ